MTDSQGQRWPALSVRTETTFRGQSIELILQRIEHETELRNDIIEQIATPKTRAILYCLSGFPHRVAGPDWQITCSWRQLGERLLRSTNTVKTHVRQAEPFVTIATATTDRNPNTAHTFAVHWTEILGASQAAHCTTRPNEIQNPGQAARCTTGDSVAEAAHCTQPASQQSPIGRRVRATNRPDSLLGTIRRVMDQGRYVVHWDATDSHRDRTGTISAEHVAFVDDAESQVARRRPPPPGRVSNSGFEGVKEGVNSGLRGCQSEGIKLPHTPSENLLSKNNNQSTLPKPSLNQACSERAPHARSQSRAAAKRSSQLRSWSQWMRAVEARDLGNAEHVLELYAVAVRLEAFEDGPDMLREVFALAAYNERLWSAGQLTTRKGVFASNVAYHRWERAGDVDRRQGERMLRQVMRHQPSGNARDLGRQQLACDKKTASIAELQRRFPKVFGGGQ